VLLGEVGAIVVIRAQARGLVQLINDAGSTGAKDAVRSVSGASGDSAA